MHAAFLALGLAATAIQWGWQTLDTGAREYIVQVEPQLSDLATFRKEGFSSDIPPTLRDIRQIRIVVGSDPLPHQGEIPDAPAPLPSGVSAAPINSAPSNVSPKNAASNHASPIDADHPAENSSSKIALTDGHQPAESDSPKHSSKSDDSADANTAPAKHAPSRSPSERSDEAPTAVASTSAAPRPWTTLLLVAGGLIISLSGNIFLGWVHWGTRSQYRSLVSQLRSKHSAI